MQLDTPLSTRISYRLTALSGFLLSICLASRSPGQEAETFFENRIRPILADNCFKCHGGKASKGGVRLDQRTALLAKGEDGPVIIPGKPGQGRLMAAVLHTGEIKMPPKKKLPPAAIKALSDWITA
ncbi:MAG: c-type cytochrome domain-containing protein, partial [Planctomycetota bacterium]|nr:c-type cytochrome domain-containing protein [Planctomycetota bacterium]